LRLLKEVSEDEKDKEKRQQQQASNK